MKFSDQDRENNLKQNGITVLGFTNDEVFASFIASAEKRQLFVHGFTPGSDGQTIFTDTF